MRKAKGRKGQRIARSASFLAPVGGWVKNENIARPSPNTPQSAERLVNIFPTATGAEFRGGSDTYATLGDGTEDPLSFLRYKNGSLEKLFSATQSAIYDTTVIADPNASSEPVVTGLTGGLWSSVQFATTGGIYLAAVNGSDLMRLYDGTFWFPVSDEDFTQIAYDGESAAFTVGATLTGGTSGATATILAVQDNGSNGFVIVGDISSGPFEDNEAITDSDGGAAAVNGAQQQIFNGVTGIDTDLLSYVWSYKSRLFFIEKGTLNFWYAAIDQIGGALTKFPMAGIFPRGGSLMFGTYWSLDTGADGGLSAQCVFVTTEGEVAVFQGSDPSEAADWSLVGVYQIGQPLGPNAWHRAGGDIVINTDIGHVPLSQAINRDQAALALSSVSYPIETAWNAAVALRRFDFWNCVVWPDRQMVLIALPTSDGMIPTMYVANARTGRWCEFTGWDAKCLVIFQGRLLFGSTEGKIVEGYVTGQDQGSTYTGVYVPLFDDLRRPTAVKVAKMARAVLRSSSPVIAKVSMQFDFEVDLPPAPSAQIINSGSVWGVAVWGTDTWGGDVEKALQQDWVSVSGEGYAMAPALQFTSGSVAPLATEIVRIDVMYEDGDL